MVSELPLTDTYVSRLRNAFVNDSSVNIKFSKTQLSKIIQFWGFLFTSLLRIPNLFELLDSFATSLIKSFREKVARKAFLNQKKIFFVDAGVNVLGEKVNALGSKKVNKRISGNTSLGITLTNSKEKDIIRIIKSLEDTRIISKETTRKNNSQNGGLTNFPALLTRVALPLIKNLLMPLPKRVLIPLGLTAAASATDVVIENKIFRWGMNKLIISNKEIDDIIKIVKSLEDAGLLINSVSETIKNEVKKQKGGFLPMLLGTLAPSLLGSALAHKGLLKASERVIRADKGRNRFGQDF